MSKILKYIMIGSIGLLLANCSSSTYKIKQENDKQVLGLISNGSLGVPVGRFWAGGTIAATP